MTDALVGADRGPLPLDGIHGARDRGGKADAILRVTHIVVHGLGTAIMGMPPGELRRVPQRVVATDGIR